MRTVMPSLAPASTLMDFTAGGSPTCGGGVSGSPVGVSGAPSLKGDYVDPLKDVCTAMDQDCAPCFESLQLTEDCNVKIVFPIRSAGFYKTMEILSALTQVVNSDSILGVGVLHSYTTWNVQLTSVEEANRLLHHRKLRLEDGSIGTLMPINAKEIVLRLCWLPLSFPNAKIKDYLKEFGEVKEIADERYAEPELQHLRNGTKRVRIMLRDDINSENLPHKGKIDDTPVLCIVFGRKPRCLLCDRSGHIARNCPNRGIKKPSFADKLKGNLPDSAAPCEPPEELPDNVPAVVPVVMTNPEKMYQEVAVPLLQELENLTAVGSPEESANPAVGQMEGVATELPKSLLEPGLRPDDAGITLKNIQLPQAVANRDISILEDILVGRTRVECGKEILVQRTEECASSTKDPTDEVGTHSAKRPRSERSAIGGGEWADEPYDTDESSDVSSISHQAHGERRIAGPSYTLDERLQASTDRLETYRQKFKDLMDRTSNEHTKSYMNCYLHLYSVERARDPNVTPPIYEGLHADFKHVPKTRKLALNMSLAYREIRKLVGLE